MMINQLSHAAAVELAKQLGYHACRHMNREKQVIYVVDPQDHDNCLQWWPNKDPRLEKVNAT